MKGLSFFSIPFFMIGFFPGCQSIGVSLADSGLTKNGTDEWIQKYLVAKQVKDPKQACPLFQDLAKEEKFTLNEFAKMRASLTCSEAGEWQEPAISWLRARWSKLKTESLRQMPLSIELAKSLKDNLKYTSLPETRVALILEAKDILKKQNKNIDKETAKNLENELDEKLEVSAPRFRKKYFREDTLNVAKDFARARDFIQAKKLYSQVLSDSKANPNDHIDAWKGLVRVEKVNQNKKEHIVVLRKFLKYLEDKEAENKKKKKKSKETSPWIKQLLTTEVDLVRAIWTEGHPQTALKILENRLAKPTAGQSYAIQYWLVARIYEEQKKLDKTTEYMTKSLSEPIKDLKFRDTVEWDLGWTYFKMSKWDDSITNLQKIVDTTEDEFHKARALYWIAQAEKQRGKEKEHKGTLERLAHLDPLGYYGMMARRELEMSIEKPKTQEDKSDKYLVRRAIHAVYKPEWVDWMLRMDEKESISDYLNEIADQYRKQKSQNEDVWLSILKSYAKGGDYLKLFEKLYQMNAKVRVQILMDHPELLFPTPYMPEVLESGKKFNVEPSLIYSITRQESAFNPEARSIADAMGLMQLLPTVAKQLGQEIKSPIKSYEELFDPLINLKLGSYLLSRQMKRHKNDFISYVASYNASDAAIKNWRRARFRGNPIEFIEDIPYEETRSYVRLIIRNYVFYKLMLSGESQLPFPDEIFGPKNVKDSK